VPDRVVLGWVHQDDLSHAFMKSVTETFAFDRMTGAGLFDGARPYISWQSRTNGLVDARNSVAAEFLDNSDGDWLMWVDTDMGWPAEAVHRLLAVADKDERPVVGGLCFSYRPSPVEQPHHGRVHVALPTIYVWVEGGVQPYLDYPVNTVVRCDATGCAFILVHRSVLERIRERDGDNWYTQVPNGDGTLGEDLSFCRRLTELEVPLYVDTSVKTCHQKTLYVDESYFWEQVTPPPATEDTAVIVPTMNRPQNAAPFMRSLKASTGLATAYAVCDPDDTASAAAWLAEGAVVLFSNRGHTFAQKVNHGYLETDEPWLFIVGDDVRFHPGWLDHAQAVAKSHDAAVVGTNDLGNPRVVAGEHATHMLIRRSYVDEHGASWDGPGVVCHEGYGHWYVDDEIVTAAKQRGVWQMALGSIVEHLHPAWGKADQDDTYRRGQVTVVEDRKLFAQRFEQSKVAA